MRYKRTGNEEGKKVYGKYTNIKKIIFEKIKILKLEIGNALELLFMKLIVVTNQPFN